MILKWTYRYCNMQYLDLVDGFKLPRNILIALRYMLEDKVLVSFTDLHKNKDKHESNFGHDKEFHGSMEESIKVVESWVKQYER